MKKQSNKNIGIIVSSIMLTCLTGCFGGENVQVRIEGAPKEDIEKLRRESEEQLERQRLALAASDAERVRLEGEVGGLRGDANRLRVDADRLDGRLTRLHGRVEGDEQLTSRRRGEDRTRMQRQAQRLDKYARRLRADVDDNLVDQLQHQEREARRFAQHRDLIGRLRVDTDRNRARIRRTGQVLGAHRADQQAAQAQTDATLARHRRFIRTTGRFVRTLRTDVDAHRADQQAAQARTDATLVQHRARLDGLEAATNQRLAQLTAAIAQEARARLGATNELARMIDRQHAALTALIDAERQARADALAALNRNMGLMDARLGGRITDLERRIADRLAGSRLATEAALNDIGARIAEFDGRTQAQFTALRRGLQAERDRTAGALTRAQGQLQAQIDAAVAATQALRAGTDTALADVRAELAAAGTTAQAHQARIDGLETGVAQLRQSVADRTADVARLDREQAAQNAELTALRVDLGTRASQAVLDALQAALTAEQAAQRTALADLAAQQAALADRVAAVDGRVRALDGFHVTIVERLGALEGRTTGLEVARDAAMTELARHGELLGEAKDGVATLFARVATFEDLRASLLVMRAETLILALQEEDALLSAGAGRAGRFIMTNSFNVASRVDLVNRLAFSAKNRLDMLVAKQARLETTNPAAAAAMKREVTAAREVLTSREVMLDGNIVDHFPDAHKALIAQVNIYREVLGLPILVARSISPAGRTTSPGPTAAAAAAPDTPPRDGMPAPDLGSLASPAARGRDAAVRAPLPPPVPAHFAAPPTGGDGSGGDGPLVDDITSLIHSVNVDAPPPSAAAAAAGDGT